MAKSYLQPRIEHSRWDGGTRDRGKKQNRIGGERHVKGLEIKLAKRAAFQKHLGNKTSKSQQLGFLIWSYATDTSLAKRFPLYLEKF